MGKSKETSILMSDDNQQIDTNDVTSGIALALIKLEYLSADTLYVHEHQEREVLSRKIAKCYRAACHALEVSILMMEQAEKQRMEAWVN